MFKQRNFIFIIILVKSASCGLFTILDLNKELNTAIELKQLNPSDPSRCCPPGMQLNSSFTGCVAIPANYNLKFNETINLKCSNMDAIQVITNDAEVKLWISKPNYLLVSKEIDYETNGFNQTISLYMNYCLDNQTNGKMLAIGCSTRELNTKFIDLTFFHILMIYLISVCILTIYKFYNYFDGQNWLKLFVIVNLLNYFQFMLSQHVGLDTYLFKNALDWLNYVCLVMIVRQRYFNNLADKLSEPITKVMEVALIIEMVYLVHRMMVLFNPILDFDYKIVLNGRSIFYLFMYDIIKQYEVNYKQK